MSDGVPIAASLHLKMLYARYSVRPSASNWVLRFRHDATLPVGTVGMRYALPAYCDAVSQLRV